MSDVLEISTTELLTQHESTPELLELNSDAVMLEVAVQGPPGPPGPPGPAGPPAPPVAGATGDLYYTHTQGIASATWTINHGLGKYPSVAVVDSAGALVEGDTYYDGPNTVVVLFNAAFGGKAYLN